MNIHIVFWVLLGSQHVNWINWLFLFLFNIFLFFFALLHNVMGLIAPKLHFCLFLIENDRLWQERKRRREKSKMKDYEKREKEEEKNLK